MERAARHREAGKSRSCDLRPRAWSKPQPSTRLSSCESLASIAAQRHPEPAKLSKLVRGDLDWITM